MTTKPQTLPVWPWKRNWTSVLARCSRGRAARCATSLPFVVWAGRPPKLSGPPACSSTSWERDRTSVPVAPPTPRRRPAFSRTHVRLALGHGDVPPCPPASLGCNPGSGRAGHGGPCLPQQGAGPEDMPRVKSQAAGAPACPRPGTACSPRGASDSRGGPAPVSSVSFLFATFLAWRRPLVRGTVAAGHWRHPGCLWSLVLAFPL